MKDNKSICFEIEAFAFRIKAFALEAKGLAARQKLLTSTLAEFKGRFWYEFNAQIGALGKSFKN